MHQGNFSYPLPANEPVLNYAPGSPERSTLQATLAQLKSETIDVPMYIGGEEVRTGKKLALRPPHEHSHVLGYFHEGEKKHVQQAIDAALQAKESWANLSWENRAGIFFESSRPDSYKIPQLYEWHHYAGTKQKRLPGRNR